MLLGLQNCKHYLSGEALSTVDLYTASPLIAITVLVLIVLLIEALLKQAHNLSFWVSVSGLPICAILAVMSYGTPRTAFNQMLAGGGYASLFAALFVVAALLTIILSRDYLRREHAEYGEFYILILFSTLGMMLMAAAADLIITFLGLELMSVCLYVLAGFTRKRVISNESSLKYFLLGAFATGFLLYGIAFVYGAAGTTNIRAIVDNIPAITASPLLWTGLGLLLVGLAFKVGAVPFHMWIPDVYQGSPTTVSGFMSTGAKAAAFSAFVIVFAHPQLEQHEQLRTVLAVISAASMILGNIVAIAQSNIKRMLAYSSIAHAGYMLTGLAAANQTGRDGVVFYLIAYTFMNLGAFGVLSALEQEGERNLTFDDYAGLGTRRPFIAALMSVYMLSLAGIPPFAGFFGKYYVFAAALQSHMAWLAIVGVLTSVVSVYYYLRLVMVMYFQEGVTSDANVPSRISLATLAASAVVVTALGIYPSGILTIINNLP